MEALSISSKEYGPGKREERWKHERNGKIKERVRYEASVNEK